LEKSFLNHTQNFENKIKETILNHTYNLEKTFRITLTTLIIKKNYSESHNNEKEEHSESDCKP
jgi:hypothetical protein